MIDAQLNRKFRNCLNSVIRQAKKNYFTNSFKYHQSNIKKSWHLIKQLLAQKSKSSTIKNLVVGDCEITTDSEIAEQFSNYFAGIGEILDSELPHTDQSALHTVTNNSISSAYLHPVTASEVNCIMLSLKKTTAKINEIPIWLLKRLSAVLSEPLAKLINSSISSGIFPECLKVATIVPIFKKGEVTNMSNYRPIALLPTFSKIFEKCISTRLMNFLQRSNIITTQQFGFLKGKSTIDAFISLTEYIYTCLNSKEHCIGIFIDLKKAFDTVNHAILLSKLNQYGVRGLPLQWLASYLRDRRQCVTINGYCSSEKTLNVGVPQGSILGPVLFLIYINDLPNVASRFWPILYADDTTLLINDADYVKLKETINSELPKICEWCLANRLTLSMDKTYAMLFTNRRQATANNVPIYMNDEIMKFKDNEDF